MSDTNKFVNAYIDVAVNQVHEYLNSVLQLKAQLKISNDLVTEKDEIISQLNQQLESNKIENDEMVRLRNEARRWETAHNAMAGKASHVDTALAQIAEMKKELLLREEKIAKLEVQLKGGNSSNKKQINKKKNAALSSDVTATIAVDEVEPSANTPKPDDDF